MQLEACAAECTGCGLSVGYHWLLVWSYNIQVSRVTAIVSSSHDSSTKQTVVELFEAGSWMSRGDWLDYIAIWFHFASKLILLLLLLLRRSSVSPVTLSQLQYSVGVLRKTHARREPASKWKLFESSAWDDHCFLAFRKVSLIYQSDHPLHFLASLAGVRWCRREGGMEGWREEGRKTSCCGMSHRQQPPSTPYKAVWPALPPPLSIPSQPTRTPVLRSRSTFSRWQGWKAGEKLGCQTHECSITLHTAESFTGEGLAGSVALF